jgi:hypothetical protein
MVSVDGVSFATESYRWVIRLTLLDHGLDGLVDVVVLVLASNNGCDVAGGGTLDSLDSVTVSGTLLCEASLNLVVATVLVAAVLDGDDVVVVLLGEDLLVEHRLLSGVVVVLVNLLVDGGDVLLVLLPLDSLVLDSRGDLLVDGGVVLTRLGHEVLDGGLGRVHFDWCLLVVGVGVGEVKVCVVGSLFDGGCVRMEEDCLTAACMYIYSVMPRCRGGAPRHTWTRNGVPKSMYPHPWSRQSGEWQLEFVIGHVTFRTNQSQPTRET